MTEPDPEDRTGDLEPRTPPIRLSARHASNRITVDTIPALFATWHLTREVLVDGRIRTIAHACRTLAMILATELPESADRDRALLAVRDVFAAALESVVREPR